MSNSKKYIQSSSVDRSTERGSQLISLKLTTDAIRSLTVGGADEGSTKNRSK